MKLSSTLNLKERLALFALSNTTTTAALFTAALRRRASTTRFPGTLHRVFNMASRVVSSRTATTSHHNHHHRHQHGGWGGAPSNAKVMPPTILRRRRRIATTTCATFEDAGLTNAGLLDALMRMEITEPTEIQSRAMRVVSGRGSEDEKPAEGSSTSTNVFIASHTGSGKTLAYLLPVIQSLKLAEERAGERLAKPRRSKVVVACPTRELAEQVEEVTKSLSHSAKFSSYLVVGGRSYGTQRQRLDAPIDVVIGTPGRLVKHVEQGNLYLGNVDAMILDEADTLFEAGVGDEVKRLLRPLKARPEGKTCVLVSATMPDRLRKLVDDELPGLEYVRTETLHRSAPGLKHRFVDCPGDVDKMSVLEQIVAPEHKSGKKIMIFCNTLPSCVAVERTMAEADIATTQYHGDMTSDARAESMRDFIAATSRDNLTMVCTDLAARGLDFGRIKVDHVINFDFPMNALDYIHRSGRTARAGAGGKVTNLVAKKDRILAGEIDSAVKLGLPIDNATSSRAVSEARKKKALADARDRRSGGASRVKRASIRDAKPASNRGRRGAARFETNGGGGNRGGKKTASSPRPRRPGGRSR